MADHAAGTGVTMPGMVERTEDSDAKARQQPSPEQSRPAGWDRGFRKFLWENGLSLAVLGLFLLTLVGQVGTGLVAYNQEQREHGQPITGLGEYLTSGHFVEATAENWESEFLQMGMFVILTVYLRQKGSAESKKPDGQEDVDEDPRDYAGDPGVPWPVRKGGWILKLYSNSLFIAFMVLFLVSFLAHAWGGAREYSEEQMSHGEAPVTVLQFMGTSEFWFQSFQNWQSEFLSIAAMVILTIWLRQYGSPESKPVHHAHAKTASE
jgi:hypothetical protein